MEVVATAESTTIPAGTAAALSATASGGQPPYVYRWDRNDGPAAVEFQDVTSSATQTEPLQTQGSYVFRVIATDTAGATDTAFVEIEVEPSLVLTLTTETPQVFEGTAVTLDAAVTGANEPFTFSWQLDSGPIELDLSDELDESLATVPLTTAGDYTFSVTVTDDVGVSESASVEVEVIAALVATVPALAVVGTPVELSATIETDADVDILWSIVEGSGTFDDPTSLTPMLTTQAGETLDVRITATLTGGDDVVTSKDFELVSVPNLTPRVRIETRVGDAATTSDIVVELDAERAPETTANFLLYLDDGFFDGLVFHRAACSSTSAVGECDRFVLQGGGFHRIDGELELLEPTRDTVASEAGNGLSSGTLFSVAMALTSAGPDSGTTQFFFNLADNSFLDDQQFTVFGQLVEGEEVIDAIFALELIDNPFAPAGEVSLPAQDVIMERVSRVDP